MRRYRGRGISDIHTCSGLIVCRAGRGGGVACGVRGTAEERKGAGVRLRRVRGCRYVVIRVHVVVTRYVHAKARQNAQRHSTQAGGQGGGGGVISLVAELKGHQNYRAREVDPGVALPFRGRNRSAIPAQLGNIGAQGVCTRPVTCVQT